MVSTWPCREKMSRDTHTSQVASEVCLVHVIAGAQGICSRELEGKKNLSLLE